MGYIHGNSRKFYSSYATFISTRCFENTHTWKGGREKGNTLQLKCGNIYFASLLNDDSQKSREAHEPMCLCLLGTHKRNPDLAKIHGMEALLQNSRLKSHSVPTNELLPIRRDLRQGASDSHPSKTHTFQSHCSALRKDVVSEIQIMKLWQIWCWDILQGLLFNCRSIPFSKHAFPKLRVSRFSFFSILQIPNLFSA